MTNEIQPNSLGLLSGPSQGSLTSEANLSFDSLNDKECLFVTRDFLLQIKNPGLDKERERLCNLIDGIQQNETEFDFVASYPLVRRTLDFFIQASRNKGISLSCLTSNQTKMLNNRLEIASRIYKTAPRIKGTNIVLIANNGDSSVLKTEVSNYQRMFMGIKQILGEEEYNDLVKYCKVINIQSLDALGLSHGNGHISITRDHILGPFGETATLVHELDHERFQALYPLKSIQLNEDCVFPDDMTTELSRSKTPYVYLLEISGYLKSFEYITKKSSRGLSPDLGSDKFLEYVHKTLLNPPLAHGKWAFSETEEPIKHLESNLGQSALTPLGKELVMNSRKRFEALKKEI